MVLKQYDTTKMSPRNFSQVARETKLANQLRHTSVILGLGAFDEGIYKYVVFEFCEGGDLFALLTKNNNFSEFFVVDRVIIPLLKALSYCHEQGVIHRDIKPENLFFTGDGALRVGDFGLGIDTNIEHPSARLGTLDYMAPEVLQLVDGQELAPDATEGFYGEGVDIWACGVLAYEMIVGFTPFEDESQEMTCALILWGGLEEPFSLITNLISPAGLSFLSASLTRDPSKRPSARQLLDFPWLHQYDTPNPRTMPPADTSRPEEQASESEIDNISRGIESGMSIARHSTS